MAVEKGMSLQKLLCGFNQIVSDIIYYEVLDMPLQDFEKLKPVKVHSHLNVHPPFPPPSLVHCHWLGDHWLGDLGSTPPQREKL